MPDASANTRGRLPEPTHLELVLHGDVARLHLGPDDIVVLKLKAPSSNEQVERARDVLERLLADSGHSNKVLIVDEYHADVSVIGPQDASA